LERAQGPLYRRPNGDGVVDDEKEKKDENRIWRGGDDSPLRSPLITQLGHTISNAINGCLPTQTVLIVVTYIYQPIANVFNTSPHTISCFAGAAADCR
jgi:hypothetical protein